MGARLQQAERIAILEAVFDCPENIAETMNAAMLHKSFASSDPVLHQGDECGQCHLVIEGRACAHVLGVDGQYVQLASYEPGEIFGPYPQADEQQADILAEGHLQLLMIPSNDLSGMAKKHAGIGSGLARIFAGQMDVLFGRMAARATLTAAGRVYAELLRRGDDDGRISPAPVVAAIAVSVQTTRETASRAINALMRRGILARADGHWEIVAPRQLEDMIA
ncbi:MAG: Crp/Fnr family transcriptional regulator [Sphingorhabdus sp.]